MNENTNDSANPVLTFEGKKYLIICLLLFLEDMDIILKH